MLKYQTQLNLLRDELQSAVDIAENATKPVALDQSLQGRVSRGDALQQQEMAKASRTLAQKRLVKINAALKRLEDGDYGYCVACDEEIAPGRLTIMPEAEYCVACMERSEAR